MSKPRVPKPISTAVAAASAATIPLGVAAAQPPDQPLTDGNTTVSIEGGVVFSKYWQTTFPGNPELLPGVPSFYDKTGSPPVTSGALQSLNNLGGYGSFSISRNIDAMVDWRFSAAFYGFGTTSSSASASQFFTGENASFTNTAAITETDRFSFETFDFDFGHNFTTGPINFRAFAGLRGLHTDEAFATALATTGEDKVGEGPEATFVPVNTTTIAQGTSEFIGAGPRVGVDFNTLGTWGLVGSASAAWIEGQRQSQFQSTTSTTSSGTTTTAIGRYDDHYTGVGNLEAMIGVAWQFSPNGQAVLGYKVDEWFNIRDSFAFAGFSNKQDVFTQIPFLKVTVRY